MKKVFLLMLLLFCSGVFAQVSTDISSADQQAFDKILTPVMKVYKFLQYSATMVGVLILAFAGVSLMTAGGDVAKKERAKQMGVGVVIGLALIWAAPSIVDYLL
ncbi:pilin [Nanoarchaeota archaeon]